MYGPRGSGHSTMSWVSWKKGSSNQIFVASLPAPRAGSATTASSSANLAEIPMPAQPILDPRRSRHPILYQRFAAVVPLLYQRIAHAEPVALDRRAPVRAHAHLRKARDFLRELLRLRARATLRREVFAQPDREAFLRRHLAPGEDDLERAPLADDARQAHGSAVDQRHAPAAAIDAEVGVLRHHAEIAPEAQLHAAGDRGTLDRGDDRLVVLQPR